MKPVIPTGLRDDLTRCQRATSAKWARIIGELTEPNPGMADVLADLEADDDLRAKFEIELLNS
jgi:hypothetical protein